ncbi:hypothetical protein LPJ73_000249 [Coemansia sp. RSA 2703]|nr:hypothetical protein LPJ73_000249 [Coemansia sp. RSA 2703]KAJ2376799.1 hypothetical protein IW150_001767 [Coemansia sp. RSA 2607]
MKLITFSTFTIGLSLLVLHGGAAPVDIQTTELGTLDLDIDGSIKSAKDQSSEFGSLEEDGNNDDINIVTVNVGFFSYIQSVLNELISDNSMDSSEIIEFVNDWNSELDKNIVYAESNDMSSSAEESSEILEIDSMDEVDGNSNFKSFEDESGVESIAG